MVDECLGKSRAWEEVERRFLGIIQSGNVIPTNARICDELFVLFILFVLDAVDHALIVAITGKCQYGSFNRLVIVIIDFKTLDNQTRTANSLVWPAKVFESVMYLHKPGKALILA